MSFELTDFLVSLADGTELREFWRDPELAMSKAGLSVEQKQAVATADQHQIRWLCAHEMKDCSIHARILLSLYEKNAEVFGAEHEVEHDVEHDVEHNIAEHNVNDDFTAEIQAKHSFGEYYEDLFSGSSVTKSNSLVFIGTGIQGANQVTAEAKAFIETADIVLYCVVDLTVERHIQVLNKNTEDLYAFYADDKPRRQTYIDMSQRIFESLERYPRVCAVFYGHPGIFVWPSYNTIRMARRAGYEARMIPAVSSLDCMFADIGFDPSRHSCQIFEATDLLIRLRTPDISAAVIVYQVACVGDIGFKTGGYDRRNVPVLAEYLIGFYGPNHEVLLYEAAQYPVCKPTIKRRRLEQLADSMPGGVATMYIPPKSYPKPDSEMRKRLGLS